MPPTVKHAKSQEELKQMGGCFACGGPHFKKNRLPNGRLVVCTLTRTRAHTSAHQQASSLVVASPVAAVINSQISAVAPAPPRRWESSVSRQEFAKLQQRVEEQDIIIKSLQNELSLLRSSEEAKRTTTTTPAATELKAPARTPLKRSRQEAGLPVEPVVGNDLPSGITPTKADKQALRAASIQSSPLCLTPASKQELKDGIEKGKLSANKLLLHAYDHLKSPIRAKFVQSVQQKMDRIAVTQLKPQDLAKMSRDQLREAVFKNSREVSAAHKDIVKLFQVCMDNAPMQASIAKARQALKSKNDQAASSNSVAIPSNSSACASASSSSAELA